MKAPIQVDGDNNSFPASEQYSMARLCIGGFSAVDGESAALMGASGAGFSFAVAGNGTYFRIPDPVLGVAKSSESADES